MPEHCSSCRAPIRWAVTEEGNPIPLDPDPAVNGTFRLDPAAPAAETPRAITVRLGDRPQFAGRLYLTHFATCPNAEAHRRRKLGAVAERCRRSGNWLLGRLMIELAAIGAVLWLTVLVMTLALCRAAAIADEADARLRSNPNPKEEQ